MSMEKLKTKKTHDTKLKRSKKVHVTTPTSSLTRGDVAKGGSSSSKTKPIT